MRAIPRDMKQWLKDKRARDVAAFADKVYAASEPDERDYDDGASDSLRDDGRNSDGTGESYAERNK